MRGDHAAAHLSSCPCGKTKAQGAVNRYRYRHIDYVVIYERYSQLEKRGLNVQPSIDRFKKLASKGDEDRVRLSFRSVEKRIDDLTSISIDFGKVNKFLTEQLRLATRRRASP